MASRHRSSVTAASRRLALRVAGALLLLVVAAGALAAHDLFLALDRWVVAPGDTVRVTMLNGSFTRSEGPVSRDRVRDLSISGPSGVARPDSVRWRATGDTTRFRVPTAAAGTYAIGVSLLPRPIALTAAEFNDYLDHDGVPDILARRRERGELDRPARERYSKHVKALVQAGGTTTANVLEPLGYPAELVPLENPYALRRGDTLRVRALLRGSPVPNQFIVAGWLGADRKVHTTEVRADSEGVARVPLGSSGRWFVKFIHMAPVDEPELDYESTWATLTFAVRAAPAR